jgi:methionine-gamma-lyase
VSSNKSYHLNTLAIHAGQSLEQEHGSVTTPIYQTSTFAFHNADEGAELFSGIRKGYIYSRMGNPTTRALEDNITALEGGHRALATASGMAAISTVFTAFLNQGDHIISTDAVYGPSRVVIEKDFSRFGVQYSYLDTSDLDNVKKACRTNTKMIYIETPANPTIAITDIKGTANIAHDIGALLAVDNTFMSPMLQRPFEHGADIVIHSMTKFLNGHTDVVAGIIIFKNQELFDIARPVLWRLGGTIDPHQAWLVLRGIKTLPLRMAKSQENATVIARFLEQHPKVSWVKYPGLKSHPQYELSKKQQDGPGALISFGVKGGYQSGKILMDNVKLAVLAVSLGGIETLIQHPASMTHATVPAAERAATGITDDLVRLSVGCEHVQDLIADLDQALEKIPV